MTKKAAHQPGAWWRSLLYFVTTIYAAGLLEVHIKGCDLADWLLCFVYFELPRELLFLLAICTGWSSWWAWVGWLVDYQITHERGWIYYMLGYALLLVVICYLLCTQIYDPKKKKTTNWSKYLEGHSLLTRIHHRSWLGRREITQYIAIYHQM